jgi:hypothetical protein
MARCSRPGKPTFDDLVFTVAEYLDTWKPRSARDVSWYPKAGRLYLVNQIVQRHGDTRAVHACQDAVMEWVRETYFAGAEEDPEEDPEEEDSEEEYEYEDPEEEEEDLEFNVHDFFFRNW